MYIYIYVYIYIYISLSIPRFMGPVGPVEQLPGPIGHCDNPATLVMGQLGPII